RARPRTDATRGSSDRALTTLVPTFPVAPVTTTLRPVSLLTVHSSRPAVPLCGTDRVPATRARHAGAPRQGERARRGVRRGGREEGASTATGESRSGRYGVGTDGGRLSAKGSTGLQPNDRPCGRMVRPGDTVPSAPTLGSTGNHLQVFRR